MNKIEDINGQLAAIEFLFERRKTQKEVITLTGPLGSGVTWALNKCSGRWQARGGAVLQARGDATAKGRSLFPWLTMAMPGAKELARLEVLKDTISHSSRAIPVIGQAASYLVQEVLNYKKRQLARRAMFLNTQEQDILYVIQRCARQDRFMLVIDQIEDWDEDSLNLLTLILSGKLDELYPSLADALILIAGNEKTPSKLDFIPPDLPRNDFAIRLLNLEEMRLALQAFGFPEMNSEDRERLYKITHSRLDLLSDVSSYFNKTGSLTLSTGWSDFYTNLVKRRVEELKKHISDLESVLTAAAIVGETFTLNDIVCLTGAAIDSVTKTLSAATDEQLIIATGDIARFDSSDLHSYFHQAGAHEHIQYHGKFAECLRLMRSGDYEHRSYHLFLAKDYENAEICYALAVLAAIREYRALPSSDFLCILSPSDNISDYLDKMKNAFQAFKADKIGDGLAILEQIEDFLPNELLAERDYLQAVLLLATSSAADYDKARQLLERWISFNKEGELWARVAQNLIMAQAQTGYLEQALQLEKELRTFYFKRQQTDPWALFGLNVLRRRSECLHSLISATQLLEKALAYFGTSDPEFLPRHPVQFYYTLTNLVGNLLASGRFEEASGKALELEELIKQHSSVPWPSLEVATNNSIIAHYLSGKLKADAASILMEQIAKTSFESGDSFLLQNNLSVLLILSGKSKKARKILDSTYASLMKNKNPDVYHQYFVCTNLGALMLLDGDIADALSIIESCDEKIDQFYPAIRGTITRRQEFLKEIITAPPKIKPAEFDNYLIKRYGMEVGPQWAFYGRGFLLTDIQFWTMD